jgi:hypothetical protein
LEQVVRQGSEQEVIGPQSVPFQAVRASRVEVGFEHASDEERCQCLAIELIKEISERVDKSRSEYFGGAFALEHELAAFARLEYLGEQVREVVHSDALLPERLDEGVVLLPSSCCPKQAVKEHLADVLRRQTRELDPRSVNYDLSELADLGTDPEFGRVCFRHLGILPSKPGQAEHKHSGLASQRCLTRDDPLGLILH